MECKFAQKLVTSWDRGSSGGGRGGDAMHAATSWPGAGRAARTGTGRSGRKVPVGG